jgi:transcriptional regulator with XRE-family HTH domain
MCRELREAKLLERWELAKRAHVSTETLRRLESGEYEHKIRSTTLRKLALGLGVDPRELLKN